jgi:outer membrane protein OmpA-like peptidoglycan-associated protein
VSTSAATTLEWLLRPSSSEAGIDRETLAGLLVELARSVEPEAVVEPIDVRPVDPRLEQLRTLLVGQEIEVLTRLRTVVEDPEQLAQAIGRVLPSAIASSDARLGQVLAPALEKATQSSIRSDPRTLINILHPLIVPAIRKSIGEAIDNTFQSLNESLKHSLTWHGLKWRFEAWRTGKSFAEVVLKHTLVYQVEHVFLVHQRTGLLIAHAAAEDAASQDPLLVSSMLSAIQDFVKDSFKGADQQGVDTLRLGDFRLWCEPGPFAMLVAVIRGNPPEDLHEKLRDVLTRIHTDRRQALETFDGNSADFADVEAHLSECAALRQRSSRSRKGFPWLVALLGLALLAGAGVLGFKWWQQEQIRAAQARVWAAEQLVWTEYVDKLRAQPGIVVTQSVASNGMFEVAGLRDPLAADPQRLLRDAGVDPVRVTSHWQPYISLDPQFVLQRIRATLDPPKAVTLAIAGDNIAATGTASHAWLQRARSIAQTLPVGGPALDLSGVQDLGEGPLIKLRDEIEAKEIHFDVNASLPAPGQDTVLDQLAAELKELAVTSAAMRVGTRVTLTGHSDDTGPGTLNLSLSLARAGAVLALLKKRGVDTAPISLHGAGPLDPLEAGVTDAARLANRRVSLSVTLDGQP